MSTFFIHQQHNLGWEKFCPLFLGHTIQIPVQLQEDPHESQADHVLKEDFFDKFVVSKTRSKLDGG